MYDLTNTPVVYKYTDTVSNKIFYVGKTKNLINRCKAHAREFAFSSYTDFKVEYIVCNDEPSALYYELSYIIKYRPILNKYGNSDTILNLSSLPDNWILFYDSSEYNEYDLQPVITVKDYLDVRINGVLFSVNSDLTRLKVLINKETLSLVSTLLASDLSAYYSLSNYIYKDVAYTDANGTYLKQLYCEDKVMNKAIIDYFGLLPYDTVSKYPYIWFDILLTDDCLILQNDMFDYHVEYNIVHYISKNGQIDVCNTMLNILDSSNISLSDNHAKIILDSLLRLRSNVEHDDDLAFSLLPSEFTLPDLQRVYEIILGKTLYKMNFRSKLQGKVEPVGRQAKSITGGKSSELYRYKGVEICESESS